MWNRKPSKNGNSHLGLDRETEALLAIAARDQGDEQARNRLVESHLGLVKRMASAFARRGANFDDLVQEGNLALMRAAQSFEPERNIRFATYAAYWIRSNMQRYLASMRSHQYGAPASVAYSGGFSRGSGGRRRLLRTASLDAPIKDDSNQTLGESLPSNLMDPGEDVERVETRLRVREALAKAFDEMGDSRAALVIEKRLLAEDPSTLAEIGRELNLSREGARLLELRLMKRVRSAFVEQAA